MMITDTDIDKLNFETFSGSGGFEPTTFRLLATRIFFQNSVGHCQCRFIILYTYSTKLNQFSFTKLSTIRPLKTDSKKRLNDLFEA